MGQTSNVINTAFVLNYFKAMDMELFGINFGDSFANKLVVPEAKAAGDYMAKIFPLIILWVKMRDKYLDHAIDKAINNGIKQIIILGSGLDTRPLRFNNSAVQFYEVEHASTINYKKNRFEELDILPNSKLIEGNYHEIELIEELVKEGCDLEAPSLILWEGNSMYQQEEDVQKLMSLLKTNFTDFYFYFDFLPSSVMNKTTGNPKMDEGIDAWFKVGAKLTYPVVSAQEFAEEFGFEFIEEITCNEMLEKITQKKLPEYDMAFYNLYFYSALYFKK